LVVSVESMMMHGLANPKLKKNKCNILNEKATTYRAREQSGTDTEPMVV